MTHLQILSAESRKYFQSAIALSGTAFNYWGRPEYKDHSEIAYEMAKTFGKPATHLDEVVTVLLSASTENIANFFSSLIVYDGIITFPIIPVIESEKNQVNLIKCEDIFKRLYVIFMIE